MCASLSTCRLTVSDEGLVGPGASGLSQVLLTPGVVAGQCGVLWGHVWM